MALPSKTEMAEAIAEINRSNNTPDVIEKDFGDLNEWMKLLDLSERRTRDRIKNGMACDPPIFQQKKFKVIFADGRLARRSYWRYIPKEERKPLGD